LRDHGESPGFSPWGLSSFPLRISGSLNLDPAENRVFKNAFCDFEAPEKKKAQPGAEAASAAACATGFYVSHDAQKHIEKNSVLAWVHI
jgi:hypothetical protein